MKKMKKLLTLLLEGDGKMMKKLLVLMLVFGLTSSASAALTLQIATDGSASANYAEVGAEYDVVQGETIWLGIYNDTQGSAAGGTRQFTSLVWFTDTANAEWTGGNAVYKPPAVADAPGNSYFGLMYGYDVWYSNMSDGNPIHYTGVGVTSGFEFKCLVLDADVVVQLMDDSGTVELDSITIHQIPEPMTIALLGLGSLFLRRRRK